MGVLKLLMDKFLKSTSAHQLIYALLLDNEELLIFFRQGEKVGGRECSGRGECVAGTQLCLKEINWRKCLKAAGHRGRLSEGTLLTATCSITWDLRCAFGDWRRNE